MPSPIKDFLTSYLKGETNVTVKEKIKNNTDDISLASIQPGDRGRIFSSNAKGQKKLEEFGPGGKEFFQNLQFLIADQKITLPMNQEQVSTIIGLFKKFDQDFDEEFTNFLKDHFQKHNITDPSIQAAIKKDLLYAYRYEIIFAAKSKLFPYPDGANQSKQLEIDAERNILGGFLAKCNDIYTKHDVADENYLRLLEKAFTKQEIKTKGEGVVDIASQFFREISQGLNTTNNLKNIMARPPCRILGEAKSTEIILNEFNNLSFDNQKKVINFIKQHKVENTNSPAATNLFDSLQKLYVQNSPKTKSFIDTFISGARAAWKSVTSVGSKAKSDPLETTPLTQVTSSSENQTGEKKGRWERFKDFVRNTFASPKSSETTKTVESRAPENTGKVSARNKSTSDIGKPEVTFAGMNSLNNSYEKNSSFEMDLKNCINGSLRCINLVQTYFTDIDINNMPESTRAVLLNDDYGPIAENIIALGELKKSADERQLMLITLAEHQILLHLEKAIKEQDIKISSTKNPNEIVQFANAKNALFFIRDKIGADLKLQLPAEEKYISVDKPNQVTKKFVGENYQQMNLKNLAENDLHNIHDQLSKDVNNIKQRIEENSGKTSTEIKKDLMELHINLNVLKDQVNKLRLEPERQLVFEGPQGPKDGFLESIKKMEGEAREINSQMLNAEKKDKWQNIASSNLKTAGSNLKRSISDLSESLSERVGKSRKKEENTSPYVSVANPLMDSHSEPTTPRSTANSEPTTPRYRGN